MFAPIAAAVAPVLKQGGKDAVRAGIAIIILSGGGLAGYGSYVGGRKATRWTKTRLSNGTRFKSSAPPSASKSKTEGPTIDGTAKEITPEPAMA